MRYRQPGLWTTGIAIWLSTPGLAQNASPFATQDPLAKELQNSSVFVGTTLRDRVDSAALARIAEHEPPNRPLKIAVLSRLPQSGAANGNRARYTKALHD